MYSFPKNQTPWRGLFCVAVGCCRIVKEESSGEEGGSLYVWQECLRRCMQWLENGRMQEVGDHLRK